MSVSSKGTLSPRRIDRGARYYKCDFQVHTPRDPQWAGEYSNIATDSERAQFAEALVACCRRQDINAIAITDHHDLCLFPYVRLASQEERQPDGREFPTEQRLVVFPGLELTLSQPACQALLLFDSSLSFDELDQYVWGALGVTKCDSKNAKTASVAPLGIDKDLKGITKALSDTPLNGRFILLPHVRRKGHKSFLRDGFNKSYAEMPCVGGYIERHNYSDLEDANREIIEGKKIEWGQRRIGVFQTSDCREARKVILGGVECAEFVDLAQWPTWVKWTEPSVEALRQACLASTSRIAHTQPVLPNHQIRSITVSTSKFLGPVCLSLNPQFNAFIGGRGTGKSTLLEYLRWALCDDPLPFDPAVGSADELPDFQKRRRSLIDKTLKQYDAVITVDYEKFGTNYTIERSSSETNEGATVTSPDQTVQEMSGEQIRREFPVISYAQKQLSSVGTLPDEILRIVTDPIRTKISHLDEEIRNIVLPRLKEERQKELRLSELKSQEEEAQSKTKLLNEQIASLQSQLGALSDDHQKIISSHSALTEEKQWTDEAESNVSQFKDALSNARMIIEAVPDLTAPANLPDSEDARVVADEINKLRNLLIEGLSQLLVTLDTVFAPATSADMAILRLRTIFETHQAEYTACVQLAARSKEQLADIQALNQEITNVGEKLNVLRSQIQTLSSELVDDIEKPWDVWIRKHTERSEILQAQCETISVLAQHAFRARLKPCAKKKVIFDALDRIISEGRDIRRREDKVLNLTEIISETADPLITWANVIGELDSLLVSSESPTLPNTPILIQADFTETNLTALQAGLTQQSVEEVRYIPLQDEIAFEFAFGIKADGTPEYIPFSDASPGQQATALMRTLLAEQGPPLLIDQPEEDLDNEQIRVISDRISETKHNRQLIFISHNANIVVNGDAELVVQFNYAPSTTTRGVIDRTGSIDYEPVREAITSVMEGGREAFELRKEKYGF